MVFFGWLVCCVTSTYSACRLKSSHNRRNMPQDISELRWPLQIHMLSASRPRYGEEREVISHKRLYPSLLFVLPFSVGDVAVTLRYLVPRTRNVLPRKQGLPLNRVCARSLLSKSRVCAAAC
jgi:hypothetical protein